MSDVSIFSLSSSEATVAALARLLIATVAAGGSVSFMHPLAEAEAIAFWERWLAAADRGELVALGAYHRDDLVGTVSLILNCPPNQPHRGEIAKMMTLPEFRGRGIARALLAEAERLAVARGRTLLVLDTATDGGASGLYQKHGFVLAGEIPNYAYKPHGGLTGTLLYWKAIGPG
ncbi:MAG: GNAT family N-acetyltransferase [Ancalomicrobiaceae bacterium]|nr:GNAT family N-acetyltransferase [Ancalomicrobiaceae bacterium]